MPYMYPDLNVARDLVNAGAASVMPLASPIGSNKGLATKEFIQILIDEIDLPIIVDAGTETLSGLRGQEMGAAAIMANTALATAGNLPAYGFRFQGRHRGRTKRVSGRAWKSADQGCGSLRSADRISAGLRGVSIWKISSL